MENHINTATTVNVYEDNAVRILFLTKYINFKGNQKMKKIINGKKYDTSTAKEIARWDNGDCLSFGWCSETLYRKKTGEYFLHGEGGPTSKYCEYSDGMQRSGEQIIPLTGGKKRVNGQSRIWVATCTKKFSARSRNNAQ